MRCPNSKCRKEIPLNATEHTCGWRATSATPPPRDDATPPAGAVPHEEEAPRASREKALERLRGIGEMLRTALTRPKKTPLEHWRSVRDNPRTLPHIREMALAAIAQLERRRELAAEQARVVDGANRQERARQVTREQLAREAREREAFMARISERSAAAPTPKPASAKPVNPVDKSVEHHHPVTPAQRFSPEDMAPDPLEIEAQESRAADPRRSAVASRGTPASSRGVSRSGGTQRPKAAGYKRASRT